MAGIREKQRRPSDRCQKKAAPFATTLIAFGGAVISVQRTTKSDPIRMLSIRAPHPGIPIWTSSFLIDRASGPKTGRHSPRPFQSRAIHARFLKTIPFRSEANLQMAGEPFGCSAKQQPFTEDHLAIRQWRHPTGMLKIQPA
jgi:hypothetical protein